MMDSRLCFFALSFTLLLSGCFGARIDTSKLDGPPSCNGGWSDDKCQAGECCKPGWSCGNCEHGKEKAPKGDPCDTFWQGYHRCKGPEETPAPTPAPIPQCGTMTFRSEDVVFRVHATFVGSAPTIEGSCPAGYDLPSITCIEEFGEPVYEPHKPKCVKIPAFCAAHRSEDEDGKPFVPAAAIGEESRASCNAAHYKPVFAKTTCSASGTFDPLPSCVAKKKLDCDPYVEPGKLMVEMAKVGEVQEVTCSFGYESATGEVQEVTCKRETDYATFWEPKPACEKVPDWCMERKFRSDGKPTVPDAGLFDIVTVECEAGFTPQTSQVTCDRDGSFNPRPVCIADAS